MKVNVGLSYLYQVATEKNLIYLKRAIFEFLNISNDQNVSLINEKIEQVNTKSKLIEKYLETSSDYGYCISTYLMEIDTEQIENPDRKSTLEKIQKKLKEDMIFRKSTDYEKRNIIKTLHYLTLTDLLYFEYKNELYVISNQDVEAYESLSDQEKYNIHKIQLAMDIDSSFRSIYEGLPVDNLNIICKTYISTDKEVLNQFTSQIMKVVLDQRTKLIEFSQQVEKNIESLNNQINNFNSRLIEIIGIIIAIFSIIGFNVFTISTNNTSFNSINLIEINISIVLFIVVLLGVAARIICDKKLPVSFYILLSVLIALLCFSLTKDGAFFDVIINIFTG